MMQARGTLPEIRKTVVLNAPIEKVWKAVATAEGMAAWWMPSTLQPVLGHNFELHAGSYGDSPCKVTELDPPNRLAFDWDEDWYVIFELKALEGGRTEFTLVHGGWYAEKVTKFGQPHAAIRDFMGSGWEKIVTEKLPSYVEASV